CQQYNFLPFIF
nr:immunoglobulin light chain junction region [Macaca mulatta]